MSFEELIAAARASSGDTATSDEVRLFQKLMEKKNEEFEADVTAQAADEVFMARTYTL